MRRWRAAPAPRASAEAGESNGRHGDRGPLRPRAAGADRGVPRRGIPERRGGGANGGLARTSLVCSSAHAAFASAPRKCSAAFLLAARPRVATLDAERHTPEPATAKSAAFDQAQTKRTPWLHPFRRTKPNYSCKCIMAQTSWYSRTHG